jgi:hypothetical protein
MLDPERGEGGRGGEWVSERKRGRKMDPQREVDGGSTEGVTR